MEEKIMSNELIEVQEKKIMARQDVQTEVMSFEKLMTMAELLSKSTIVPVMYQNRAENCFVALDMASRMGISPMIVMQNLYIVQGKPSWSGSAIASMIRASKEFTQVELHYVGTEGTDSYGAYVTAIRNGKEVKGGTVTIAIAKKEGWFQKAGSKWQTIPSQMLGYRAYAWFGRLNCPELLMGLQTNDEVEDVYTSQVDRSATLNPYEQGGK